MGFFNVIYMQKLEKGNKKLGNAWAFYDWANSVYPLVVSSSIFPLYYGALFKINKSETIYFIGIDFKNTALISFVTAFAFLIVAIISPILSGIADYTGKKKRFMQFFCYLGAFSCMGLSFFDLENLNFGILCFFLGLIGYWGSLVFYNSYLPDIAFPENHDKLSAIGYSMGYIGSVILLVFNLILILNPNKFGILDENASLKAMQYSFISVGIWWIIFSQFTFYYLPNQSNSNKVTKNIFFNGFKELKKVWHCIKENDVLKKYLKSFFVFSMAVQTVMLVATYFGEQEVNWKDDKQRTSGLIISILLIQIIAVFGALFTSKLSKKVGNFKTLILINIIWIFICVFAYFVVSPIQFYCTAAIVGLVMGGIQSLARSTYSKLLPETNDTTSFFSFYDVSEKLGIVIGMGIFAFIDQIFGSMRFAILFLALFFCIGVLLLLKLKKISNQ